MTTKTVVWVRENTILFSYKQYLQRYLIIVSTGAHRGIDCTPSKIYKVQMNNVQEDKVSLGVGR